MPSYTEEQRRKAIEAVEGCGGSVTRAIRKLGYPPSPHAVRMAEPARRLAREEMRQAVEPLPPVLNAIMDEQADMACEDGANSCNGHRELRPLTPTGKITLRIPKLRSSTHFSESILERYKRVNKAAAEMYAKDVSTHKLELVAAKLGINAGTRLHAERPMLVVMEADG